MSDEPSDPDRPAAERVDARQVALVVLAVAALVVAAFLAPTVAVPAEDGEGGDPQQPPEGAEERPEDGFTFDWLEWLSWLFPEGGGNGGDPRCTIILSPPPEPGADVTVTVRYEDRPLADAPVWFEDRRVGRTDDRGQLTAEVPYVRELSIRVGVEGAPDCRADTGPVVDGQPRTGLAPPAVVGGVSPASLPRSPVGVAAAQSDNASVSYDVNGELALRVDGDPYPGESLRVRVRVNGRPVSEAAVRVDGERVATTDEDGTATVTVPDDGRDEFVVRATRGEFAAEESVDVLLLETALESPNLAVVPGAEATVVASFADRPAEGAVVTVDGERVGRTDAGGRLAVQLPADPTATVRVEARDQTATTSVVGHYLLPAALLGLLVAVATGVAYWRRDARAAGAVLAGSGGLVGFAVAVALVDAFVGSTARDALLVAALGVIVLAVLIARRATVRAGAETTRGLLARLVDRLRSVLAAVRERSVAALLQMLRERLLTLAVQIATAVGEAVDVLRTHARVLLARLRSLPRSVTGLLARFRSALAGAVAAVRRSPLLVAWLLAALALPAAGYALDGRRGLAVAAAVVVAAGVLARRLAADDEAATADETTGPDDGVTTGSAAAGPTGNLGDRSFREIWRAFARLVVPGAWRTSTPDEVARAAVEQGYPEGPVEELTALFREVEYGGRALTAAVRDRAADALERLRGGGEES